MDELVTGRGSRLREPRCWSSPTLGLLLMVLAALGGCRPNPESASSKIIKEQGVDAPSALNDLLDRASEERDAARNDTQPLAIPPRFVEVAQEIGIRHHFYSDTVEERYFLPEVMGGGAAWLDFDLDGWLDVYYANGCPLTVRPTNPAEYFSRLFRNRGTGQFADITLPSSAGACRYGQGVAVGDFDADGFADVFLANYGPDVLLRNLGDGTFEEVTETAGMVDNLWGSGAAWFDADRDGDLDLYVVNYLDVTFANTHVCEYMSARGFCGPGEYEPVPDFMYVNQGDGTFVESLEAFGMTAEHGKGLVISVLDFNLDLEPEIYVGNDMTPNFLFASPRTTLAQVTGRTSDRPYIEVAGVAGCAVSGAGLNEATMGIACADYDNNGLPDIYLTHFFNAKNTFYRNLGNLTFTDDSAITRVTKTSMNFNGFGCVPIDYDRDGWLDIVIANGHVLGPKFTPYKMKPQLLRNDGQALFSDISAVAGDYFQTEKLGRGLAGADYDNDGDLDVTISHLDAPIAMLRNETETERNYVGLELRTADRIPPVGGRVVFRRESGTQTVPVVSGGSYESAPDYRLLVGMADDGGPVSMDIYWPSGRVDQFNDLEVNRYYVVYEGAPPRPADKPAPAELQ